MKVEIKIKYPVRKAERNYLKDWDVRVNYKDEFPSKADIATDYKELPISNEYWKKQDLPNPIHDLAVLDTIFYLMNHDEINPMSNKEMQTWIRENKVSHTSMSVGDVIELDNKTFVCATVGWKEVA